MTARECSAMKFLFVKQHVLDTQTYILDFNLQSAGKIFGIV